jgi:hypothetical protein
MFAIQALVAMQKASFQEELEGLHEVIRNQGLQFNTEMGEVRERLGRHRRDIEKVRRTARVAQEEVEDLEVEVVLLRAQVDSMESRLCRCGEQSPVWSGRGTAEAPLELDEEGSQGSFHSATSSAFSAERPAVVQVSTVMETAEARLVPIGEVEVVTESSRREREMRVASWELVRLPFNWVSTSTQNRRKHVAHRMSTAISSQPCYDHRRDYHLGVHHRLRQRIHRASRKLGGYESSSESGSSGFSDPYEDCHHDPGIGAAGSSCGAPGLDFIMEPRAVNASGTGGGGPVVVVVCPRLL